MSPVERLSPTASTPVYRVEPQSRERRRREPEDNRREARPDVSREPPTDVETAHRASENDPATLIDPDAPGRRVDIKA